MGWGGAVRGGKVGDAAVGARKAVVKAPGAARASLSSPPAPSSSGGELVEMATKYTSDLKEMGMTMALIRRYVATDKNDLKKLQVFQDALKGVTPTDDDEITRLQKVLEDLNALRLDKAEEELFWSEREGLVVSDITDGAPGLSESEKSEVGRCRLDNPG